MKVAIVTTTIHVPALLTDYCANARQFNHQDVHFYVIGDRKTPTGTGDFCRTLARQFSYLVDYYDVAAQQELLMPLPALARHLPYDSIQRRNIGMWLAYRDGADVIITIDDDNFVVMDQDFVGSHAMVGSVREYTSISSSSGWYNVCELLKEKRGLPFYHRGFPMNQRWQEETITTQRASGKIVVNAGLWLGAPDVDAVTWLDLPIETIEYTSPFSQGVGLARGTWSPFNSQNTALAREVVPAYFLSPYIGRYDDIWASYMVKYIADHLGDVIHFGLPLVRQERNPHNYLKDFDQERLGMEVTGLFLQELRATALRGKSYQECFGEVVHGLATAQKEFGEKVSEGHRLALEQFQQGIALWQDALVQEKVLV